MAAKSNTQDENLRKNKEQAEDVQLQRELALKMRSGLFKFFVFKIINANVFNQI